MECPGIAVCARGLTVRGMRGPVFEEIDVDVDPGGLFVAHGPSGSGRTALLLTLAGRMRFEAGTLRVDDHTLPRAGHAARERMALARVDVAYELEPRLRVRELIAERLWAASPADEARVDDALAFVGSNVDKRKNVEELASAEAILLGLGLALAERPGAIVVDAVDRGCTPEETERVWNGLQLVRSTGCTVLASATWPGPVSDVIDVALPRFSADRMAPTDGSADHDRV